MRLKPLKLWQITVILVTIFVLAIGGSILGVYLTNGFGRKNTPPQQIDIEDVDNVYDNSTGQYEIVEPFKIKITSPTESVNMANITFKFGRDAIVTELSDDTITDGVIIVPKTAKLGDEILISPRQHDYNEGGQQFATNAGGISELIIETENNILSNTTIQIAVDVPIHDIELKLIDASPHGNNRDLGNEVAEGSTFVIRPQFIPAKSQWLFSDADRVGESEARRKEVFYAPLTDSEKIDFRYNNGDVSFVAGARVSSENQINAYAFTNGSDQKEFYRGFESFDREFYDDAITTLDNFQKSEDENERAKTCLKSVYISVVEATIGSFTVKDTSNTSLNITANKLFTLYAGPQVVHENPNSTFDELVIGIQDQRGDALAQLNRNVGIRLISIYAKSDEGHTRNLVTDALGQTGPVLIKGGTIRELSVTRNQIVGGANTPVTTKEKYLLINSEARLPEYYNWEFATDGEYEITAEVVLTWQDKDEQYKLFTDDDGNIVSHEVCFTSTNHDAEEQELKWKNNMGDSLTTTLVYNGSEIVPSQIDLANLYSVPGGNVYQKVVFFAYLDDGGDISEYVMNLDTVGEGNYSTQISGVTNLYPIKQSSELMVNKAGKFKLLFATVKTNAYGEPILTNGRYQIVKAVSSREIIVNKTLRGPKNISYSVSEDNYFEDIYYAIPTGSENIIQLKIELQDGDAEVFDSEKNRISFFASEDREGVTPNTNVFEFGEPNIDKDSNTVTVDVSINEVEIAEQRGQGYFFFVQYDNTYTIQTWKVSPSKDGAIQQVYVYEQKVHNISEKSSTNGIAGNTYKVVQSLKSTGDNQVSITGKNKEEITSLEVFNQKFQKENFNITDIFGREIPDAQFVLTSANTNVVNVVDNALSFNYTKEIRSVLIQLKAINPDPDYRPIEFTVDVQATGVSKVEVDDVAAPDMTNVRASVVGKEGTNYNLKDHYSIYVQDGETDVLYSGGKDQIYLSSSFIQNNLENENLWAMLKINNGDVDMNAINANTPITDFEIAKDFGQNVEIAFNVRGEEGTINFIFNLQITAAVSDSTNNLNDVDYGFESGGVLEEDKTLSSSSIYVYAGYDITLDDYLKVRKSGADADEEGYWANIYKDGYGTASDFATLKIEGGVIKEGGVLRFDDVYAAKEIQVIFYAVSGNEYSYSKRVTFVVCPNYALETENGGVFTMRDFAEDGSGGEDNSINFSEFVKLVRKTPSARETDSGLEKTFGGGFEVGTEAEKNNFIKVTKDNDVYKARFNRSLDLGYNETSKTATVWLVDDHGARIDNASCELQFEVGVINSNMSTRSTRAADINDWLSNTVLYGGKSIIFVLGNTPYSFEDIVLGDSESSKKFIAKITGSPTGAYSIEGSKEGRRLTFSPSGKTGVLVDTTRYINFEYYYSINQDGLEKEVLYASKAEPVFVSFVGDKFATIYDAERDFNDYFISEDSESQDLAQLLAPDLLDKDYLTSATLQAGKEYYIYSPADIDGQEYSFDENGKLTIGSTAGEVTNGDPALGALTTVEGTVGGKKYRAILRHGFKSENDTGWRLVEYDGNIYLSGLKEDDCDNAVTMTWEAPNEWSGLLSIGNNKLTINDVVGSQNLTPYIWVTMGMSGQYEFKFKYRLTVVHNAELVAPIYPYDGEAESLKVEVGNPQTIDMSAEIKSELHQNDHRFPDKIKRNGGEATAIDPAKYPSTISVVMIKQGEEDITNSGKINVTIKGNQVTIDNINSLKDVTITISKTYTGIYGGVVSYTFLINSSEELQYYLQLTNNEGDEEIGGDKTFNLTTGKTETISVQPMYLDLNTGIKGPLNEAVVTAKFDSDAIKLNDQDGKNPIAISSSFTLAPADFVPNDTYVTVIFSIRKGNVSQENATQLRLFVPATKTVKFTNENLTGGTTYSANAETQSLTIENLTEGYAFNKVEVVSATIEGIVYAEDTVNTDTLHKNLSEIPENKKFWKEENAKITFYHTIKDYVITLKLTYAKDGNVGSALHTFTVNKSLTFFDNISMNEKILRATGEDADSSSTIYGGIDAYIPYTNLFTNSSTTTKAGKVDGLSVNTTNVSALLAENPVWRSVDLQPPAYPATFKDWALKLKLKDVSQSGSINFTVDFTYTQGSYTFSVPVHFSAIVDCRATIQANYPQISGGDYESIESGQALDGWNKEAFGSTTPRLTGSIRETHNGNDTPKTAITYSDIKIRVLSKEGATLSGASNESNISENTESITFTLETGNTSGTVVFEVEYHGARTSYTVYVVQKRITATVRPTLETKQVETEGNKTKFEEVIYTDQIEDTADIFGFNRLIELKIDTNAIDNIIYTVWLVNQNEADSSWSEVKLTEFKMLSAYRNETKYIDWGGQETKKDANGREISGILTKLQGVFTAEPTARIEFRREGTNTVVSGATATRLAGRIELSYTTKSGSAVITSGVTLTTNFEAKATGTDDKANETFVVDDISYKIGADGEDNNIDIEYSFVRKVDLEVTGAYLANQPTIHTIVTNYMYTPNGGGDRVAYSFVKTAGLQRASTGKAIEKDDIVDGHIKLAIKVINPSDTVPASNTKLTEIKNSADYQSRDFKYHNDKNEEYMTFRQITTDNTSSGVVYDFVVFGEGCKNDGDYVLTEFTYSVGENGVEYKEYIAFYLVPGYQITVNNTVLVTATVDKTAPDTNEKGITTNLSNVYSFRPTAANNNQAGNKLTIVSESDSSAKLSVKRPLWSDVEIAQAFNITMVENDNGYNITATMGKLGTLGDFNKKDNTYTFKGKQTPEDNDGLTELCLDTKGVVFGEKLYKMILKDNYGYTIEFYFKLLPEKDQNPTVSGTSNAAYIEGENFDVGALFERLVVDEAEGEHTPPTFSVQTNQQPAPESSQIKRLVVQGVDAYGFTAEFRTGAVGSKTYYESEVIPDGKYKKAPTLHDVTISKVEFIYSGDGGTARAVASENQMLQISKIGEVSYTNRTKGKSLSYNGTTFKIEELSQDTSSSAVTLTTTLQSTNFKEVHKDNDSKQEITGYTAQFNYLNQTFTMTMTADKKITSIKQEHFTIYQAKENDSIEPSEERHLFTDSAGNPQGTEDKGSSFVLTSPSANVYTLQITLNKDDSGNIDFAYGSLSSLLTPLEDAKVEITNADLKTLATDDLYYPTVEAGTESNVGKYYVKSNNDNYYRPITAKYTVPTMPGWIYGTSDVVSAAVQITLSYESGSETETATLAPFAISLSRKNKTQSTASVVIDGEKFDLSDYFSAETGSATISERYDDTLTVTVPGDGAKVDVTVTVADSVENSIVAKAGNNNTIRETYKITQTATRNSYTKPTSFTSSTGSVCKTYYASGTYNISLSDMLGRTISPSANISVYVTSTKEGAMISYGGTWFKVDSSTSVESGGDGIYRLSDTSERIDTLTSGSSSKDALSGTDFTGMKGVKMKGTDGEDKNTLMFSPKAISYDVLYLEDSGVINPDDMSHVVTKSYVVKIGDTYYRHVQTYNITRYWSYFSDGLGTGNMLRLYVTKDGETGTPTPAVDSGIDSDTENGYKVPISAWGKSATLYRATAPAAGFIQDSEQDKGVKKHTFRKISELQGDETSGLEDLLKTVRFEIGEQENSKAKFDGTTLITGAGYTPSKEEYILINVYAKASRGPFKDFDYTNYSSPSDRKIGFFRVILEYPTYTPAA